MMARHWTESEDTAVRLGAALDNEDGGQRQRAYGATKRPRLANRRNKFA